MSAHGLLEKVYSQSPVWFQNIMISVYGYKLKKQRYGLIYNEHLAYLKDRDYGNFEEEKRMQNEEFLKLLHYAVKHSKFYREFYKNVDINSIRSVDDIDKLPILDKETLRKNIDDVYTINPQDGIASFTGGTTGKSLCVIFTREDNQKRMAVLDAFKYRHGFDNGKMKSARFNGKNIVPLGQKKDEYWRNNWPIKQRIYSSFYISQDKIPFYVKNLNEFKPEEIDGFVTSIYDVAKYMHEHGIEAQFAPKAIFPTSETVLPMHRQLLKEVFHCEVRDQYASSEGAPFIMECVCGNMHEDITTGVFEHIKTEHGTKLIVTSFTTYGTPLIRYDIGDNVLEHSSDYPCCTCGSSHPIVKAIDGRQADYLISEERGNINLGNLSNVIKELPNCVKNIQFVQNSLSKIDIYIVVDPLQYKNEFDELILKEMQYRFGNKMKFQIHKVEVIEREKSGKYRLIKNNI